MNFVSNDGSIQSEIADDGEVNMEVAEALVYFSYEHSASQLLLVDVQGVGTDVTDTEISTLTQNGLCIGNCRKGVFYVFFLTHECSRFCEAQSLSVVDPVIFQ